MDRNSVIGLVLIAVTIIVFSVLNAPSDEQVKAQQAYADSVQRAKDSIANLDRKITTDKALAAKSDTTVAAAGVIVADSNKVLSKTDSLVNDSIRENLARKEAENHFGDFYASATGENKEYILENEKIKVYFNARGGAVSAVELKEFKTYTDYKNGQNNALKLFDADSSGFALKFFNNNVRVSTDELFFSSEDEPVQVAAGKNKKTLTFTLAGKTEKDKISLVYTLKGDSYDMAFDIRIDGFDRSEVAETMVIDWKMRPLASEKLISSERMLSSVFYKYRDEDRTYLSETSADQSDLESPTEWVAFKTAYFSSVLMMPKCFRREGSEVSIAPIQSVDYIKQYNATLNIAADRGKKNINPMRFYFGPNDYKTLSSYENGMDRIINLGWGIFGWVNRYLVIPVFRILESFDMGYGLIILVLTLIVKILIFPLTYRNYKSSAKMRVLKPDIAELNKKFADEPMKKQQATMALYRTSGVSPLAGCIPVVIQMPVLIAVFRFFPAAIELRQKSFLWADDLSAYDSILDFGSSIPLYGDHISLFTLLMCASTILLTYVNSGQMDTGQMPGMKVMMYIFPVMMLFFFNNMAAGLSYYYFISNLMGMGIMWAVKRYIIDEEALRRQIALNRAKPDKKKSKFQQRLEDMQKQRQQQGKRK